MSRAGVSLVELLVAVAIVGVGITSAFSQSLDARMAPGDSVELNGVTYQFGDLRQVQGPNYTADVGEFMTNQGHVLRAEKRYYAASMDQAMTEAGIVPGFTRDLFVALGEPIGDGSWGVRINDKPLVRWIWLGAFLMAFGGLLAITDRRYRRTRRQASEPAAAAPLADPQAALHRTSDSAGAATGGVGAMAGRRGWAEGEPGAERTRGTGPAMRRS
jgi:cytochrome c-type biogenesis protein CcmF